MICSIILQKKNIFIKSYKENEENEDYYIEKDFGAEFKFLKTPFRVTNFPNYISTAMEIQNGINDFTLKDKLKIDLEEILDELNGLINEKTKVKIEVRNKMKTKCKEFIDCRYRKDNLLKKVNEARAASHFTNIDEPFLLQALEAFSLKCADLAQIYFDRLKENSLAGIFNSIVKIKGYGSFFIDIL